MGAMTTAGTALVCDLGPPPHSTIAYSLPPVCKAITVGIEKVSGGQAEDSFAAWRVGV